MAAANPTPPSQPVDPITTDRARAQMEDIMSTATTQTPTQPRRYRLAAAVAAAFVVVVGATMLGNLGTPEPLVLAANGGDSMAICAPFDQATLATMGPAFAGTVVELTDSVATLEVDRWFTDGEAQVVEIGYTPGFEALIGTPDLEVGQRYLISTTDGIVNGCGYSGPATADYEATFERAFGA